MVAKKCPILTNLQGLLGVLMHVLRYGVAGEIYTVKKHWHITAVYLYYLQALLKPIMNICEYDLRKCPIRLSLGVNIVKWGVPESVPSFTETSESSGQTFFSSCL